MLSSNAAALGAALSRRGPRATVFIRRNGVRIAQRLRASKRRTSQLIALFAAFMFCLLASAEAWAQFCHGGSALNCDGAGSTQICDVNTGGGTFDIVCDSTANGDTTAANYKAVLNGMYVDVYGTDSTGASFCCKLQAVDPTINVYLLGGAGADTIGLKDGGTELTAPTGATVAATVFAGGGNDTINGSDSTDPAYSESLYGEGATDTINAGNGIDYLYGGDGSDTLNGGGGNDDIWGGNGADTCEGGDGDDDIYGEADGDTALNGGNGNDYIAGGDGDDTIDGGNGDDVLHGDADSDTIYGGAGFDSIFGGTQRDFLYGQGGADLIRGGAGNDDLFGGDQDDTLCGDGNLDKLRGEAGDDSMWDTDSSDEIYSLGTDQCGDGSTLTPAGPCALTLSSIPPECT